MDANGRELILKAEVFEVVGCAMEVLNALGHGLLEKPYENGNRSRRIISNSRIHPPCVNLDRINLIQ